MRIVPQKRPAAGRAMVVTRHHHAASAAAMPAEGGDAADAGPPEPRADGLARPGARFNPEARS